MCPPWAAHQCTSILCFYLESGLADHVTERSNPTKRKSSETPAQQSAQQCTAKVVPPRHRTAIRTAKVDHRPPTHQSAQFAYRSCAQQCTAKRRKRTNSHSNPTWCLWVGRSVGRSVGRPKEVQMLGQVLVDSRGPRPRLLELSMAAHQAYLRFSDPCLAVGGRGWYQAAGGTLSSVGRRPGQRLAGPRRRWQPDQDLAVHGWGSATQILQIPRPGI